MDPTTSREKFIAKAKARHPDACYAYDKVLYIKNNVKVKITCLVSSHGDFKQRPNAHLNGQGCPKCGRKRSRVKRTKTREEFIANAKVKHLLADYDYSKIEYASAHTKVTITCLVPGHGDFRQKPNAHLNGQGCPKCGGTVRLTTTEFVAKAKAQHPEAGYVYDKIVYLNDRTKVTITCPVNGHGDFEQAPTSHLQGKGCPRCGQERSVVTRTMLREEFVARAKARHLNADYGYDNVVYVNSRTKVTITCPVPGHGDFKQSPDAHLGKQGCPRCGVDRTKTSLTKTREEFIAEAQARHPLAGYGYDKVVYMGKDTKVTITCPVPGHGDFKQRPHDHLVGNGCPKCAGSISRVCTAWLDDLGIAIREHPIRLPHRRNPIFADGYDPKTNTVYEFLGDYYHGNPAVYDPNNWDSASRRMTYGQKHARLMRKLTDLRTAGYNIVTMWEQDFRMLNKGRIYPHDPLRRGRRSRAGAQTELTFR